MEREIVCWDKGFGIIWGSFVAEIELVVPSKLSSTLLLFSVFFTVRRLLVWGRFKNSLFQLAFPSEQLHSWNLYLYSPCFLRKLPGWRLFKLHSPAGQVDSALYSCFVVSSFAVILQNLFRTRPAWRIRKREELLLQTVLKWRKKNMIHPVSCCY